MSHTVTTTGPYYVGTGEISFNSLRTTFKGTASGEIRASELFRKTDTDLKSPNIPDCVENNAIAEEGSTDWKTSQLRGIIKNYTITQTGNDTRVDGDALNWNNNLTRNIPKTYQINGNITSAADGDKFAWENEALQFILDNIVNLKVNIANGATIKGAGGLGGPWTKYELTFLYGSSGGNAFQFNSNGGKNNIITLPNTSTLTVAGGGGGGGFGGTGANGLSGPCWKPRISTTSGSYTGTDYNPGPWGEWYSYKINGGCQCEWYSKCPDPTVDGKNLPITIRDITYNSMGRTREGNEVSGAVAVGRKADNSKGSYYTNRAGGGCKCNWFWCRRTCIDGAYCTVSDPIEVIGAAGGAGGSGGNGIGYNQSRGDGAVGEDGEEKQCPNTGNKGEDGGTGGNGADWGQRGKDGQGVAGYSGGAAGKAIYGTGYKVEGYNSDNLKGDYKPD